MISSQHFHEDFPSFPISSINEPTKIFIELVELAVKLFFSYHLEILPRQGVRLGD